MSIAVTACSCNNHSVKYLEHVVVVMTLTFTRRGDLTIKLISPRGTVAILLPQRREDYSGSGFTDWEFMSTHTWGEDPKGTWNLEIENHGKKRGLTGDIGYKKVLPLLSSHFSLDSHLLSKHFRE